MALIAFGCEARVGKDTAVDYLMGKKGGIRKSFAAPLYNIQHYTYTRLGLKNKKDRELLQLVGDWARKQNKHIFIEILLREIDSETGNVYVSDVRYPNEFFALKNRGFTMVRLIRENRFVSADTNVSSHSSENSLQDYPWDVVIRNDSDLHELYAKLDRVYSNSKG